MNEQEEIQHRDVLMQEMNEEEIQRRDVLIQAIHKEEARLRETSMQQKGKTMTAQVEEFLINMLNMGLSLGDANARTYEYALALLLENEAVGSHATSAMMEKAVELVREAWNSRPLKYLQDMYLKEERAKR